MFSTRSMFNFGSDLFNIRNARNAENTDQFDYNCGGYALGTFSWYLPSRTDEMWGFWLHRDKSELAEITEIAVKVMLEDFADLRVISDLSEVRTDEFAIAFRCSSDGDFHFVRQFRNEWYHKCGVSDIYMMEEEEVFSAVWNYRYDGPIVLFAKKF